MPWQRGVLDNGAVIADRYSYVDGGDGTSFARSLVQATAGVVDAVGALKLLLHESGLQPFADNGAAVGIFQLDPYDQPFTGLTRAAFKALTAEQQLPYAARWWRGVAHSFGIPLPLEAVDLYWLNYLPATVRPGVSDDYTFVRSDDTYLAARSGNWVSFPGVYTRNAGLDHGGKGYITRGDMRQALDDGAAQHPHFLAYFLPLLPAEGSSSRGGNLVASIVGLLVAVGIGATVAVAMARS